MILEAGILRQKPSQISIIMILETGILRQNLERFPLKISKEDKNIALN